MKRFILVILLVAALAPLAETADAARRARTVTRTGPHGRTVTRTTVVVHRSFPLRRTWPAVVVRPARAAVVVAPVVYLAPVMWRPVVVARPAHDRLAWEDGETLYREDDWTEFTLNADSRGQALFIEVIGKAQLEFAEVVFENGDARVVDFSRKTRGTGLYQLLDFRDGRKVDHVRMVARAKSDEARLVLRMEK